MKSKKKKITTGNSGNIEEEFDAMRLYLAIALVSCTVLLFEVAITRILSVVLWYHFVFLSLSLAMLGLGVPGVWFSLRNPGPNSLRWSLFTSAVAIPCSIVGIFKLAPILAKLGIGGNARVSLVVVCILVPMLALGSAICPLLIAARGRKIGGMYGADLIGGMAGALLVLPLMKIIPTPQIIAFASILPLAAAVLACRPFPRFVVPVFLVLGVCLIWGEPFKLRYSKLYIEEGELEPIFEKWTPTARITIFDRPIYSPNKDIPWAWGLGTRYQPQPVPQMWIEQDGSAGTPIEHATDDLHTLNHLLFDVTGVGYQLEKPKYVCVIGAGGGRDILTALQAGATKVEAVELNGAIVDAVSGPIREFSGDPYHLPGVTPVIKEGRSFLMHSPARFDMIQISLVDSWAATSAGAYALSENFLYTVEAFQLYWERLSDGGTISISRWTKGFQQLESARLVFLAVEALKQIGISDPKQHIAFVDARGIGTLLISREVFTAERLKWLDEICAQRGFIRHWPTHPQIPANSLVHVVLAKGIADLQHLGLDLSPPTDEKPFFFQAVSLLQGLDDNIKAKLGPNEQSVILLRRLLVILFLLTISLFSLPFVLQRRLTRHPGFWKGNAYFGMIGLAFMFIEIPWIQKFILYLGHPSYATTVVLASLLFGAGLGSMTAGRISIQKIQSWSFVLPIFLGMVIWTQAQVFDLTLGCDFGLRVVISTFLLVPAGVFMGFPFPSGMLRFGDGNKAWFWAVNGALSVLASVFSLALAMLVGFSGVSLFGLTAYMGAVLIFRSR